MATDTTHDQERIAIQVSTTATNAALSTLTAGYALGVPLMALGLAHVGAIVATLALFASAGICLAGGVAQ